MTATTCTHAIDLTKGTDVPESASQLLIMPHVPSFKTVRSIACDASHVLVKNTNSIRMVADDSITDCGRHQQPC